MKKPDFQHADDDYRQVLERSQVKGTSRVALLMCRNILRTHLEKKAVAGKDSAVGKRLGTGNDLGLMRSTIDAAEMQDVHVRLGVANAVHMVFDDLLLVDLQQKRTGK